MTSRKMEEMLRGILGSQVRTVGCELEIDRVTVKAQGHGDDAPVYGVSISRHAWDGCGSKYAEELLVRHVGRKLHAALQEEAARERLGL